MTATEDETKAIRDDIAWAETGPWTEITAEVEARVAEREAAFDRWLRKVQADAWRVGFDQSSGMDRGYDSRPGVYKSTDMAHEIDHWNPYTGTGYVDPYGDEHIDDCD